mgnify:CR=1 FL=1
MIFILQTRVTNKRLYQQVAKIHYNFRKRISWHIMHNAFSEIVMNLRKTVVLNVAVVMKELITPSPVFRFSYVCKVKSNYLRK